MRKGAFAGPLHVRARHHRRHPPSPPGQADHRRALTAGGDEAHRAGRHAEHRQVDVLQPRHRRVGARRQLARDHRRSAQRQASCWAATWSRSSTCRASTTCTAFPTTSASSGTSSSSTRVDLVAIMLNASQIDRQLALALQICAAGPARACCCSTWPTRRSSSASASTRRRWRASSACRWCCCRPSTGRASARRWRC